MSELRVSIESYRGRSFEVGEGVGAHEQMKDVQQRCEHFVQPINIEEARTVYQHFAPHLLDEMEGMSETLSISLNDALTLFSGYDLPKLEGLGCTALMTDQGYVRNYDFGPDYYDGRLILRQPSECYATCGHSLLGIGLHDGMNEHGLTVGLHFVSTRLHQKGLMAGIIVRMVLDTCRTVEEAIILLKDLPHADEYNYSLTDASGKSSVVEIGPSGSEVRCKATLYCTNHFQKSNSPQATESSIQRLTYLENHPIVKVEKWFDEFRNPFSPLFFRDYDNLFGTLHTVMMNPKERLFKTVIAGGEEVITIHFQDWVNGGTVNNRNISVTL
ncbi:C45 family autoproteolytic acyltransferase/hydolase [Guptibacillus sedimenti]|uniref:C45 family autoproteolytic acyltransferase/hydolase n=1 Tax=Guptibacillus sedimenti TaxID=3025680 RepID=UPI002361FB46|nr:C45 family peptidase [Pseudalkalibacillus sedimenti]